MADVTKILNKALAAYQKNDDAAAQALCQAVLTQSPERADAWTLLGMVHKREGRIDEALAAYETALTHLPSYAEAHNNIGNIRRDQRRTQDSIDCYRRALQYDPKSATAWHNLGALLDQHQGKAAEALLCFDQALAIDPGNPNIHWDRALALLSLGRFDEGFKEYESRWQRGQPAPRQLKEPPWRGEALNGKTVLVYAEQGFGDALQFIRFLPAVTARGGRIVLEVQGALCSLMQGQPGIVSVTAAGEPLPAFDCHVALMSIPYVIGADHSALLRKTPYLNAPGDRLAAWKKRIPPEPLLRVGLVWGGNPNVKNDAIRSPRLQPLRPLFDVPGVRFYFLQKGPRREDLTQVNLPDGYVDLDNDIQDFSDTAAAIANLDLVISSDTSVAHLSGALGTPLWLLAQCAPDWRWALQDVTTPWWYPDARIFRQPAVGRWDLVVAEVATALTALAAHATKPSKPSKSSKSAKPVKSSKATAAKARSATALYSLLTDAFAAFQQGKPQLAQELCEQVIAQGGKFPDAWNLHGVLLRRAGKLNEAAASFRSAIALKPDFHDAFNNLGNCLKQQADYAGAITAYREAVRLQPNWAAAWKELSDALRLSEQLDEAHATALRAVALDAKSADALANLGNVHAGRRHFDLAEQQYRLGIALEPARADLYYNLGLALQEQARLPAACDTYLHGLTLDATHARMLYNLALAYQQMNKLDLAEQTYLRLLKGKPDHAGGSYNLAALYNTQGNLDTAMQWYQRCVEIDPNHLAAESEVLHLQLRRCDWSGIERARRLVERLQETETPTSSPQPFPFLSLPFAIDEGTQQKIAALHARSIAKNIVALQSDTIASIGPRERLRIGYVSSDFHNHATAHLMLGLFKRHDRKRVEIHAYSFGPDDGSSYRKRIVADCDRFTDLHGQSAQAIAHVIAADKIDILVDLKGYTRDSLAEIFAWRPAPVQVAYLGYPGSMAADFIDYVITDRIVTPPQQQAWYTERFAYMPHCYQVNDNEQQIAEPMPSRAECGLPQDKFVFCCFCTHYKIEPMIFGLWMQILQSVPNSVLWLMTSNPQTVANLRREAESRGVSADRLHFAPLMPKDKHLSRVRQADLFLDTFFYNGHTTVSDALWAGVPVITTPGKTFASRVGSSLLQAIGMPELIAADFEQYVALAITLSTDANVLRALRDKLAMQRLRAPLFDTQRFARDLDDLYWNMWDETVRLYVK